jgi:hypothetical protein
VGKEHITGCIPLKQRPPGKDRLMSANIVADAVKRLGKDLVGKNDVALCLGDHLGYRIGFLVPKILPIELGNKGTGIKDNNRITHG